MNLLTLRAQARLDSSVAVADYSNANLDIQLNTAYYRLATIVAQLEQDYFEEQNVKFNLVALSSLYSLPTDCIQLKQVRLAYAAPSSDSDYRVARHYDPTDVHVVSSDEESVPTSYPIYDMTGNYVRIKPTPTTSVTAGGKLWYIARPSALTLTSDTPILPLEYHDLISTYGAMKMAFKHQKWGKHSRLEATWNKFISPLMENIKNLSDRDLSEAPRFKGPSEVAAPGVRRELTDD